MSKKPVLVKRPLCPFCDAELVIGPFLIPGTWECLDCGSNFDRFELEEYERQPMFDTAADARDQEKV